MIKGLFFVAIFGLVCVCDGQVILTGQCDDSIAVVSNFTAEEFLGTWYEIASYGSANALGTCASAVYSEGDNGTVSVTNSQVYNQTLEVITGYATLDSTDAILEVFLEVAPDVFAQQQLKILATDYENYAISYSCVNVDATQRQVYAWILSRSKELSNSTTEAINEVIASFDDLSDDYFITSDQSEDACFYFPEHVENQPVVFPGSCDASIQAMADFDVERYLGTWHEIESYPSVWAQGSCSNAHYSLSSDGSSVVVYNTQVVNETLDEVTGGAFISSDDGSGKLTVSLPATINGVTALAMMDYWVLDTDYDSYAIVYSCLEQGDSRGVWSWKLSRTKTLAAAAVTAINAVVDQVQVLDERYYQTRDQSTEGCFYYPTPEAGKPVVFPGQCDDTIAVQANFDITSFAGTWYEVEAYPKAEQPGQCRIQEYSSSAANSLDVVYSQVTDQFQTTGNASLVFSTTDGSARLLASVDVDGVSVEIPFFVLSTDYESYALAYSCVNLDTDFRSISSWKLSRTTTLTAAATTAIDNIIDDVLVLDNEYFEAVDQSEAACAYLPDIAPGELVIIDGQCDEDVAVMQDFDAERYMGRWRIIESYPTDSQTGNCHDTTFVLQSSGDIVVTNTQVINQTLDSLLGTAQVVAEDSSAKLEVTFPVLITGVISVVELVPTPHWVLDTDYDSYALVYSCVNINAAQKQITSWKMSRTAELSALAVENIQSIVDSIDVLSDRFYEAVDQSNDACFYYPSVGSADYMVFRGQCDDSIQAVPDFDLTAYLGVWNEIEHYPSQLNEGSCNYAEFTEVSTRVEIVHSKVVDLSLQTIDAYSYVSSMDGSGKMTVTYPVVGASESLSANYWVLATDYTDYAFVYSCQNLNADERAVYSWKLSRTKELPENATAVIDEVMESIDVLDQRYFEVQDQSDDGCFYLPEVVQNQYAVFPGTCDESISVVSNFNLEQFSGVWNEIAAYPKSEVSGTCVNYDFTLESDNVYAVVSSQVVEYELVTSNTTVSKIESETDGKFTIPMVVNGSVADVPYWILATDYLNYALAYSCINVDENSRLVYSWKLSRTSELSNAANTAINAVTASINVLNDQFYFETGQSDSDCFYLPDLSLSEPVIFPGQCDQNITVVDNFDAVRYMGQWYDIASYYDAFQEGTCNDAFYALTADGTVEVYNTQVVDYQLDSITGTAVASEDGTGKLQVEFPIAGTDLTVTSDYWILATDYDSYALVYSCTDLADNTKRVFSWKLSRTRALSTAAQNAINTVVNEVDVLNERYFIERDHSDDGCFYFPEHVPGQVVSFRGQCNESVPVVQDFDVERYMGIWYDVSSYPQDSLYGSCSTNSFTWDETRAVVDIYNTQVVDQQLVYVSGVGTPDATDAAKMIFTLHNYVEDSNVIVFTVNPHWVLATDYDNYALAYSCVNTGSGTFNVISWKLSRTHTLSDASNQAIAEVIDSVLVLDEEYFEDRSLGEEECFFYPDNNGGPVILDGACDANQNVVANFNSASFAGAWYEAARFPTDYISGECSASNYVQTATGFTITQTVVYEETLQTITGVVTVPADGSGALTATFTYPDGVTETVPLYVLATDYTDYALLSSCKQYDDTRRQVYSWKLSRSQAGLSQAAINAISAVVSSTTDLFENYYLSTDQTTAACFYYPSLESVTAANQVILPGTCDESIVGVPNFNAANYLGRWYEHARYPVPSQAGSCSRAEYSLGTGGVVDVFNSEVVDQTLEVMPGTAVAAADGTGRLDVTFVLDNGLTVEANYYVLSTDYDNYALVYSCRNLEDGTRQVSSWKLGRTRTWDSSYDALIAPTIEATQGLLEDYYQETSQSDEACFYIPEVNTGEVLFSGQCADISGVQGFDAASYAGWWHEISAYSTGLTNGDCLSTNIEASGAQYLATDTAIFGLEAEITTATLTITDDGRISRVNANGQVSEVLVLATDYNTYSLLYSCENVDEAYRRVWSAKHSKSRTLSAAAETAMASVIAANDVLLDQFYIPVDQSDEACFHYPEQTGDLVVLPGQCDTDIPAVSNFDAVMYTGTWYEIEKYPTEYQDGSCVGAQYSLNEQTGVVSVLNWQVADGELETLEGSAVVSSTDGSGQLTVTLPIPGTETTTEMELRVLATDYVTYSLAYSCVNVDEYHRAVGAWKLSRSRSMSAAATTAINQVIGQREELYQPYFTTTDQDEECPEPSSSSKAQFSIIALVACVLFQYVLRL